jgi:predicted phosphodiesterase
VKIQLLSDLHLETELFDPVPAPGADLLALAGDIDSTWQAFERFAGWPVPVLVVAGNHEFDGRELDPRYGLRNGTASFCNADDDLLPGASLWLHGHLHCRHDYRVVHPDGRLTRVVCRARGLASKGEERGWDAAALIAA